MTAIKLIPRMDATSDAWMTLDGRFCIRHAYYKATHGTISERKKFWYLEDYDNPTSNPEWRINPTHLAKFRTLLEAKVAISDILADEQSKSSASRK